SPWRLCGPEGAIGSHALSASPVPLPAEEPVCLLVVALDVCRRSGGGEIIHNKQGVLCDKCQPFQRVARRGPTGGPMPCVHASPEMLHRQGRRFGLEGACWSHQVQSEVCVSQYGPIDPGQQWKRQSTRSEIQESQASLDRVGQFVTGWRIRQPETGQGLGY